MSCSAKISFTINCEEEIEENESPPESETSCSCDCCDSKDQAEEKTEQQSSCEPPAPPEEEITICMCTTCTEEKPEKKSCAKETPPAEQTVCCCTTCTEQKPEKTAPIKKTASTKKTSPAEQTTTCCCTTCTEQKPEKRACSKKKHEKTAWPKKKPEKTPRTKKTPSTDQTICCTTTCNSEKTPPVKPDDCENPGTNPITVIICNMPSGGNGKDAEKKECKKKEKRRTDHSDDDDDYDEDDSEVKNKKNRPGQEKKRETDTVQKNADQKNADQTNADQVNAVKANGKEELDWTPIKKSKVPIVWILGKPGTGKETQAQSIVNTIPGFVHISTGELLRGEIETGSPLGQCIDVIMKQGALVPTDIVKNLLHTKMVADLPDTKAFLIDGYPRDKEQADQFVKDTKPPKKIIYLDAPDDVIINRLKRRGQTSSRPDDNEESIRKRLEETRAHDEPLLKAYKKDITKIDTNKAPKDVFPAVRDALIDVHPHVGFLL